jgi:hypothetical protein
MVGMDKTGKVISMKYMEASKPLNEETWNAAQTG